MENSREVKCSSSTLQSQEARDQTGRNPGQYFISHAGQDLRTQVHGRMLDPTFPLSPCSSSHADLGNSFLALLSGPASLLQFDFQEFSNSKPLNTSIKLPIESSIAVSPTGSQIPPTSSWKPSENGSYQNMQSGADLCPLISSRATTTSNFGSNSVFPNGLPAASISLQGSDLAKTVLHDAVLGNEKLKDFTYLRGELHNISDANAIKLQNVNNQMPQKLPLAAESSASINSSRFPSGCPRVFCMDRSGDLLLSNTGLLGILCSCHCFHMSVSKFCEHSGLWNINPGDAIHMDSGETIAQWRKLYFQKFGIRVPEDQSGWDWPEGLPLAASLMRSGVSMSSMPKKTACINLVAPSEALARSGRPLSDAVVKNFLADQNPVIDALHDEQQRNGQDGNKFYLKGLVGTSLSNSCSVGDNHVTDCSISRCSTMPNFAGRGPENVCQSMYIDAILKSGSLATAHPALQNCRALVKSSDVGRGKDAQDGATMEKDGSPSSIELKLGQPYQHGQSPGNPVLPVIGPQFYNTLVSPHKPFSQEQLINNVSCQGEEESRRCLPHAAHLSDSTIRRKQDHLRYGNSGNDRTVDSTELEKLNMAKPSVVSLFKHYALPEGTPHSKATNSFEYVMSERRHCESHAVKFDSNNFSWNGGNSLDEQCIVPESVFLKPADNGKEVGCLANSSYIKKASGSNMQKWMGNPSSYTRAMNDATYSNFSFMHDKNRNLYHSSNVPPDVSDAANFSVYLQKGPCFGNGGLLDHAVLTSMDSRQILSSQSVPKVSPSSTSTCIPGLTLAMLNRESICMGPYLLDDNQKLLALGQLLDLSKQQHAMSSFGRKIEQGNCSNSSNIKAQHSFVEPSVSEEQTHVHDLTRKQEVSEVVMKLDQPCPPSKTVDDVDKSTSGTGLNRLCNFSTFTQGMPFQFKEFGMQCQLSHSALQKEQSLRLDRCQNNIIWSNEHETCCQRTLCFQYNCTCAAQTKCIEGNCNLRGGKPNPLREQNGSMSCKTPMLIASQLAKDHMASKVNAISFDQCGMLKGELPKNATFHTSQWKDVPRKLKRVCEVACAKQSADTSLKREYKLGQLGDNAANCFDGAVAAAASFKEQDMSNISSGCSTPAVTQASTEFTNVESSTVVGNSGCINNLVVDEGSGIDKCWSSDDAFESDRSADFHGSTCKKNLVYMGSHNTAVNKSSRSLLDEVKLMDSLTWKKGQNQKHNGITVHGKNNHSQEFDRGLKTGKRKREIIPKVSDAPLGTAAPMLHGKYPEYGGTADWPCLSENVQMVSAGQESSQTSGAHCVKANPKDGNCMQSVSKSLSRNRDLHRLYNAGDGEANPHNDINHDDNSCEVLEILGRKKFRSIHAADLSIQFQRQDCTQAVGEKAGKYDSLDRIKASSAQHLCHGKAKPVACGKYGEIVNGNLNGDVSKPAKIVSLDKVLKTAQKCSLPKICKPGLTSSKEIGTNFSWSNACFGKFSNLTKEKEHGRNVALLCKDMNVRTSLEKRSNSFANYDEQSADEVSMLEKSEGKNGRGCVILDTIAHAQSRSKYRETRKRSLYELTLKGKSSSPKMVSRKKNFKYVPKMKLGKTLRNSEKSHDNGSQKVDPKRCAREQKHLSITDMDSFCSVCRSSNKDEVNCLLECRRCSIRVHQACYGVSRVPKGHWYCRPCRTSAKDIVCVLCGYGGGAMTLALRSRTIVKGLLKAWNLEIESVAKNAISSPEILHHEMSMLHSSGPGPENRSYPVLRPVNIEPSTSTVCNKDVQNHLDILPNSLGHLSNLKVNNSITAGVLDSTVKQWVHMVCGLWTPGTRCPNVNTMSAFDVSGASCPRANVVCSICDRPGGSCIQCRVANCSIQFHPWCAHQKGLLQSEAEGVDNENVGFYGRCVLHATYPTIESACDSAIFEAGYPAEKEVSCARTEGYKGRKRDGFWHNTNSQSKGKSGCLVPQEQFDAWVHINGQKSCAQGILKLPMSEKEYDCRKEYTRYKQGKAWKHLVVYKSGIHALGLYTARFISRGEMVVEYVGEIVGLRVADKRENEYQSGRKLQYKSACYFFRIDKENIIDATHKGGIARFVNHSCLPNCVAKVISVRNDKKVVFFAERDIYPGEEITYDYHFNHEDEDCAGHFTCFLLHYFSL
eukprot:XP_025013224.1 uncharacterized protein LOC8280110 isoform X2 [Ricinus communis]